MTVLPLKPTITGERPIPKSTRLSEPEDFGTVYRAFNQQIRSVLFRMGLDQDLEDVVQNVFLKAWQKRHTYREEASFKTWLTRIAINEALDHIKKKKPSLLKNPLEWFRGSERQVDSAYGDRNLIQKAMATLTPDHRSILVLCLMEEFSHKEAAEALGLNEGTVKSRLSRAKQAIKEAIKKLEEPHG